LRFLIEAFDKQTDYQVSITEIPTEYAEHIKSIMGWTTKQQGWEGYDLNQNQVQAFEKLMQISIADSRYYFQLTCNGPY
jgi:agmatine/peptidylarginine deiminase